jgi:hypothetical protein
LPVKAEPVAAPPAATVPQPEPVAAPPAAAPLAAEPVKQAVQPAAEKTSNGFMKADKDGFIRSR